MTNEESLFATERMSEEDIIRDKHLVEISSLIKHGMLDGDGTDQTAQRNGIILAFNKLSKE